MASRRSWERALWAALLAHVSGASPDELVANEPVTEVDQRRLEAAADAVLHRLYRLSTTREERRDQERRK